jgi:hypothetical protein
VLRAVLTGVELTGEEFDVDDRIISLIAPPTAMSAYSTSRTASTLATIRTSGIRVWRSEASGCAICDTTPQPDKKVGAHKPVAYTICEPTGKPCKK